MGMGEQHNLISSIIKIVFVRQVTENLDSYPWNINCDFATGTLFTPLDDRSVLTITLSAMFNYKTENKPDVEGPA